MSKSEKISKEIDWLQKVMMILIAVFVYVTIYEFELTRAIIVDIVILAIGYKTYKKMTQKLDELEDA